MGKKGVFLHEFVNQNIDWYSSHYLPLYVIFICFTGLVWSLYSVSFGHNCNITPNIAFTTRWDVIRVRQQSPLVVKLMVYKTNKKTISLRYQYYQFMMTKLTFYWFLTRLGVDCANIQFESSHQCSTTQKIFGVNHLMGWFRETNIAKLNTLIL